MQVKINSIKESGLPKIMSMHRHMKILMPKLIDCFSPNQLIQMGPSPFESALNTIIWFAYGERPQAPNVQIEVPNEI